jgi:hypothetical protein
VLPKFENDSIATRGVTLNPLAVSAARSAISARSSALGSIVEPRHAVQSWPRLDHLHGRANHIREVLRYASHQGIRVSAMHHHGRKTGSG